jgi:hypothetical protein
MEGARRNSSTRRDVTSIPLQKLFPGGAKMPVELIGEAGTPGASPEWINAECRLAIRYLKKVCGEPPPEMELEVQWQEQELGKYPTIVMTWEDAIRGALW